MHKDWPGINNDTRIPTFEEYFLDEFSLHYPDKFRTHEIHRAYACWQEIADAVTIFDMHDSRLMRDNDGGFVDAYSNMVQNFICSALPGTNHTCLNFELPADATTRDNQAENLDYDILAVYAYESGWITDKSLRRDRVVAMISEHVVRNNITLPLKCPAKEVFDYIYRDSLRVEKWAKARTRFQETELSTEQKAEFDADWETIVAKNKFCNVDTATALQDERWQTFFRSLKSR